MRAPQLVDGYPQIGRRKIFEALAPLLSPSDLSRVATAYQFSKYAHRGQKRKDGVRRYFEHPKAVLCILFFELRVRSWYLLALGLLHDTKEDSFLLTWENVERNFGKMFSVDLKLVTKEPKRGFMRRLMHFAGIAPLLVKLADRLHNLRTLDCCSDETKREQIQETKRYYVSIADLCIAKLPTRDKWRGEYLKSQILHECTRHERSFS